MAKLTSVMWSIRKDDGKEFGPYSTEAVLKLIRDGSLVGTEYIRAHPDGKWMVISRQTDFYEMLLQALEEKSKPKKKPANIPESKKLASMNEETVVGIVPDTKMATKAISEPAEKARAQNKLKVNASQPTIEMQDLSKAERKVKARSAVVPMFILFVAILAGAAAMLWPEKKTLKSTELKRNLLAPKAGGSPTLTVIQIKAGIQKAVLSFTQDTYEAYLEAQSALITVVEGAPQNAEARGFLCLVYKELWPFVKQDAKDLETIAVVAKSTRAIEPIGINGTYCDITKLMTLGRYKEARGVIEYVMSQSQYSLAPVLYAIRAELIAEEGDARTATLYAEKAVQLWPEWIKPKYDLGKYAMAANDPQGAISKFQQVYNFNPKHKKSQLEYGIILYTQFRQAEEAERILAAALATQPKVDRQIESRALYVMAQIARNRDNLSAAKSYAQKAYEYNPGDKLIQQFLQEVGGKAKVNPTNNELVFLGDQYFRTGNCLAAQAEYKTAFELDPKNALAAVKAARCLWQISQAMSALTYLNKAIAADKNFVEAYTLLADYQSARFDFISATQTLNKVQRIAPNNHEVLRGFGLVEMRRNNPRDAIAYLQRAQKIFENDVETLILLAKANAANKDYTAAQRAAVRAIEIDGTNVEAQIIYAQVLAQFQGVNTGAVYLKDLIAKFAYTIQFREALATLYVDSERYLEAQKIYNQLLDVNPKNKKALLGSGQCLQGQNLFEPALRAFLAAGVIDPSDAEPLFRAGLLYLEAGKYVDGIKQFKRAVLINPNYPKLNYYIGKAALLSGDSQTALSSAMEERKINPNIADSYILAAEVYDLNKDFTKCAQEYQQATKLRPQGADLFVKMARCYRQSGSPDVAESMLNIAASKESGNPEIFKEQGAIFEQRGDQRAAAEAYAKYLALSPNARDREEVQGRINSLGR